MDASLPHHRAPRLVRRNSVRRVKKSKPPQLLKTQPIAGVNFVLLRDVETAMRDGVVLRGDLFLPAQNGVVERKAWPCVLIRTPYNKEADKSTTMNPGQFWVTVDFCCFIQDCRGRFKSDGTFTKYVNEGEDGYDTVEWIAQQNWCNGNVCTYGTSYLCHVQTSLALHRPPHLTAMFCIAGGFWNAHTSGVRQGGAFEARQWVWGIKKAQDTKDPIQHAAIQQVDNDIESWFRRFPFKKGDSPLTLAPDYEAFLFKQASKSDYDEYWKQIGYNTEEHVDQFADVPALFLSGWYDIYGRSTVEFFTCLQKTLKSPLHLIMGPWSHTCLGQSKSGEVDFGTNARIQGNLAPSDYHLASSYFDSYCDAPIDLSSNNEDDEGSNSESVTPQPSTPSVSTKGMPVQYFRMGGGDGKMRFGHMYHSGVWLECSRWPPVGVDKRVLFFARRKLIKSIPSAEKVKPSKKKQFEPLRKEKEVHSDDYHAWLPPLLCSYENINVHFPEGTLEREDFYYNSRLSSSFQYDPRNPVPSIGGNMFPHKNVLMAGPYNQVETPKHFLCQPPYLPLSSRNDVLVFRSSVLQHDMEVSGSPSVVLYISSNAPDTDFTAKLIDEYPPNSSYPGGFAMNITHGIIRCRYRDSREKQTLMKPNHVYKVEIEMYPTSNLFARGHRIRVDISSSNYPHFDLNLNNGGDYFNTKILKATNTIFHAAKYPSHIILPIMARKPAVNLREQVHPNPEEILQQFADPPKSE